MLTFLFLCYEESNRSSNFFNIFLECAVEILSGEFHFMLEMIVTHMNDPKYNTVDFICQIPFWKFRLQLEILFQYIFESGCNFK